MLKSNIKNLTCFACHCFIVGDYGDFTMHIRRFHKQITGNNSKCDIICSQMNCTMRFTTFGSYRLHLLKLCGLKNNEIVNYVEVNNDGENDDVNIVNGSVDIELSEMPMDVLNENEISHDVEMIVDVDANDGQDSQDIEMSKKENLPENSSIETVIECDESTDYKKRIAIIMLKLKANCFVTHSSLNIISREIYAMLCDKSVGDFNEQFINAFQQLNTQYKRMQYFKTHFKYFEPTEIFLGIWFVNRLNNKEHSLPKQVRDSFQYFPFQKKFNILFSNAKFRLMYFAERRSTDGLIRSQRDGTSFSINPIFVKYPFALRLQLWCDEVEHAGSLGSKTRNNGAVSSFAIQLLNIPPSQNSLLSNIHLFALVTCRDIKKYGYEPVLRLLMDEIEI